MVSILYVNHAAGRWKKVETDNDQKQCEICGRTMKKTQFYLSNNLDKYPDGMIPICKKCLTMTVDNWRPSTFLHILQKADVPYIPREWDSLLAKYGQDTSKLKSTTIIGRYLSKMKLRQNNQYRFKDTPLFIQQDTAQREAFMQQLKSAENGLEMLDELDWDKLDLKETPEMFTPEYVSSSINDTLNTPMPQADMPVGFSVENTINYDEELTLEEKQYLVFKWGKSYSWEDLVRMETLYQETADSFDVSNPNHRDYLKKICKASLQLDTALDHGDADGAAKYSRMYDMLNKSAKFTAASNLLEKDEYIGSVGELVAICEKEGFIPRFHNETQKDLVDKTIDDMNYYIRKLISDELNLSDLIDSSVKMIAAEQAKAEMDEDEELTDEELREFEYEG